ncbi:hypothetical protein F0365_07180 [Nonlabens sp. Ci31]|jgi:hypothetical protein|uniref:hypothetical protein n=1 Tax=Nonlabens sp. Ci31 TaxID=2608253 RepID=UPI0014649651|nr:hypothetical protein [Nonlabens sp. Ci31]QJP34203.1 hypothetical protein F0365_07180 [Nonlabens sp. Ci31]
MKKGSVVLMMLLMALCFSCLSDKQKKVQADEKAMKKLEYLDMNSIDRYPLFDNCDEMLTTADCFYEQLHAVVDQKLNTGDIPIHLDKKDSIYISITVSKEGRIRYDSLYKCAPTIDKDYMHELLKKRLNNFPVIKSAQKKAIPVATTYKLPIVFSPVDSLEY